MAIGDTKTIQESFLVLAMPGIREWQHPKQGVDEGAIF